MAHKHLAKDCRYLGGHIPLGYLADEEKHFQLDPVTAPIVRRVFEMYLSDAGYTQILRYLNGEVFQFAHRKAPWKKSDLNYLLNNPIYAGIYVHKLGADKRSKVTSPETVRVPGGVPAILTEEEWQRVCDKREDNRKDWRMMNKKHLDLLAGLTVCAVCGERCRIASRGKDRNGTIQRYYYCPSGCIGYVRIEKAEAAVIASAEALLADADFFRKASAIYNQYADGSAEDNAAEARPLQDQLRELAKRRANIVDFIAAHGDTSDALAADLRTITAEQQRLTDRLAALQRPPVRVNPERFLDALQNVKKETPRERCREAIHTVFSRVRCSQDRIEADLAIDCVVEMTRLHTVYCAGRCSVVVTHRGKGVFRRVLRGKG
jgi:site-specific DNA recombinase